MPYSALLVVVIQVSRLLFMLLNNEVNSRKCTFQ